MLAETHLDTTVAAQGPGYRRYALILLTLIYTLSMLDRQIVTILAEPIKADLALADWQLGAISGLAFALFYTLLGLPIARIADRGDRSYIISGALALWSGFTVLCGLATSFPMLVLARLGVGVGEAGGTPPAHSLIAEFTPREKRASALAVYCLGIPIGSLLGLAFGGLIADAYGWRAAFIAAGAPGILVAILSAMTLKEPRRAQRGLPAAIAAPALGSVLKELRSKPAFAWVSMGAAVAAFGFYGQSTFYGSLFLRTHKTQMAALAADYGLGPGALAGLMLGIIIGVCAGVGTYLGGPLADRFGRGGIAGYVRMPAAAMLLSAPFFAGLALAPTVGLSLLMMAFAVCIQAMSYGPAFAAVQSLVRPTSRALASAVMLFVINLIGLGLGPLLVGLLSDALTPILGPTHGLRWAMATGGPMMAIAGLCFLMGLRTARRDEHRD
jgi:MFS family permease